MDGELKNFIKLWTSVTICLIYCFYISSKLPKGLLRLCSIFPILYLFTTLPFHLTTLHLSTISFFFLFFLANFKLLLFSFDKTPLSPIPPNVLHFIFIASLPIKLKKNNNPLKNSQNPPRKPQALLKFLVLVLLIYIHKYKHLMSSYALLTVYCAHVYIVLDLALAISATPVHFLGLEIEPQFNNPHLSTSVQNFWGRRWNLVVSSILRPSIYHPLRHISAYFVPRKFISVPAIVATFAVSGLVHEVIFFHATRASPTWEVTWFFILHGIWVAIEVVVKKTKGDRWLLKPVISRPLTLTFVLVTAHWLFFPPLMRNGTYEKSIGEYYVLVNFLANKVKKIIPIDHARI